LTIDITAVGTAKRRSVLRRAGARVGDLVYVTGHLGSAHAGLGMLRDAPASGHDAACVARYLRPEPRVRAGLLLGRNRAASSCIDISDGLADGVARLAEASGVGIVVDESALPIEGAARAWFTGRGVDPVQAAIAGGDDYELLFTVRPRQRGRLRQVAASGGVPLTCIGVCTAGTTVLLKRAGTGDLTPMPEGFSHFR
jgi:thiamine-monophosphate kinase